jgi:AraC-like DNA-binding protein
MDYYQRRRVLYAARLLAEDPDTITEISHRMGFSDAAHFCRQFKRIMGVNPTEYRRQTGKGPGGYA